MSSTGDRPRYSWKTLAKDINEETVVLKWKRLDVLGQTRFRTRWVSAINTASSSFGSCSTKVWEAVPIFQIRSRNRFGARDAAAVPDRIVGRRPTNSSNRRKASAPYSW